MVLPRCLLLPVLLLVACEGPAPSARRAALSSVAPAAREHRLSVERPDLRRSDGAALVRGGWGQRPGEFGRALEASRPGPMSLAVDGEGRVHVLDQVNRRIQRFDRHGRLLGVVGGVAETAEDLVLTGESYRVLVYVPGAPPRYRIDRLEQRGGRARSSVLLPRELELATRLLATGDRARPELWLELERRETVLVARGETSVPGAHAREARVLGRPAPGLGRILARREASGRGVLLERVLPGRYTGRHVRLALSAPILALEAAEGAANGAQALLLNLAASDDVPRRIAVVVPAAGAPFTIELAGARSCDVFRAIALAPDGALHVLETDDAGVTVRRFSGAGAAR